MNIILISLIPQEKAHQTYSKIFVAWSLSIPDQIYIVDSEYQTILQ